MPTPSALLTDLYQLTMSYAYWRADRHEREAIFHLYFRKAPFGGPFAIACGLQEVIEYLRQFRFTPEDLRYLRSVTGNDGKSLFPDDFLAYLENLRFSCTVDAVPEGTVVLANEPLIRIRGPIIQAQLIETALLNMVNFQTLVATKAARICEAAGGDPVLEFGLRRAQGPDGGLSASRAAYIGGCVGTSNVDAGSVWGIPVKGTHAHSWVMSFDTEKEAFMRYIEAMPNNATLLVDTYDTVQGIHNAIEAGKILRERGHKLTGIRLDSGDLAALSIQARRMLDEAGLQDVAIVASNDLDEYRIRELKEQGARISVWGVGTRLVTGHDQPALGGVYKLSAMRNEKGDWKPRMKLSDDFSKSSMPGCLQVLRRMEKGQWVGDEIVDEWAESMTEDGRPLLQEIFDEGNLTFLQRDIHHIRSFAAEQWKMARTAEEGQDLIARPSAYLAERMEAMRQESIRNQPFEQ